MSDLASIEMGSVDRPTRFQVNPVNHRNNNRVSNSEQRQTQAEKDSLTNEGNLPREVYRRLASDDREIFEDDTFNESATTMLTTHQSLQQPRQSIKSSFRDKDKPSRFKDMQTTRFQVEPQNEDSDDSNEDRELLENEYDTKYGKSFRHFTREALPRLDNYRNIMSIQAAYRPTLDELHNATVTGKNPNSLSQNHNPEAGANMNGMLKFGWIQGVFVRCLLNIWGVMLFLRLSWVVGQAGVLEGCILILTTTAVTSITALSMSAISTNGVIKGGGTYYMISRSLGPEFGGSIGLIFSLANAVACAMYVVGFCESMNDMLRAFGVSIIDGGTHDVRIIGTITIFILLVIVVVGMEWESKAQIGLLIILLIAIVDFLIGSFVGPKSDLEKAKGFLGYNGTTFAANFFGDYRVEKGEKHGFFSVFAIFFPAATGILAGANISGDLKDPQSSIPKGTLLAIVVTTGTYLLMVFVCGATVVRNATGNVTDTINGSFAFLDCYPGECEYGLQNSFQVIELVSIFGPLIYAGCFAATLSSALASLVSAPKVFQALCKDELYPKIVWFAKGYGRNNEPVRGYVLTFILAVGFILIGELNLIAPLISNFFLAAYMLINFSTFHASLAKPVGWRPTFKYYNMWLSLLGSIICVAVMFLISRATAIITFAAVLALYLVVAYRKPNVNWGSTTQAQTYKNALMSVHKLSSVEEHVKNYRPQILVLSGLPNTRPVLVDFAYMLTKNLSLLVCGHVLRGVSSQRYRNYLHDRANTWFQRHRVKAFYSLVDGEDFETASRALMQASGVGKLKPNILLVGYKTDWPVCDKKDLIQYFNVMHKALDMYMSVAILRIPNGLDCSQLVGDESNVQRNILEVPRTLQPNESSADLNSVERSAQNGLSGSMDSLSRNVSQEVGDIPNKKNGAKFLKTSSTSDLSFTASTQAKEVSGLPDPADPKSPQILENSPRNTKQRPDDPASLYKGPGGVELPKEVLLELTQFTRKRSNAVIDVWWLYDDGGLTLLLPYIISTRRTWQSCKLRVYALANKKAELEFEQRSMASLLSKFRIDYSDLQLIPDITKKPQESSIQFFNELIKDFIVTEKDVGLAPNAANVDEEAIITDDDMLAVQDKTNRYLRLREYLQEKSKDSDLVVMTLPMPRKNIVSAPLYMAWLESLSRNMPPFLFVRGNQTSVLTFYSNDDVIYSRPETMKLIKTHMKLKKSEDVARFSALYEFMKKVDSSTLPSTKFTVDFTNFHDVEFIWSKSSEQQLDAPLCLTTTPTITPTPTTMPTTTPTTVPSTLLAMSIPLMILNATETAYDSPVYQGLFNAITPTNYPNYERIAITHTDHLSAGSDLIRLEHAPHLSKAAMIKVYVLSIMAFLSLLGNIMTMWNIYKTRLVSRSTRHNWSAIYTLIFHLSIADVLVTGFCIIGEAAWCYTVQWTADELTCKFVKLFQMFSLYLSTYVLVLIGVDRWVAVKYPMKLFNMTKRCYRLLGGIYIISLFLSLPQFFIFHVSRGPFIEEFHQCVTHGFYTAEWQEQLYATFTLVFTFLLPLVILSVTYVSSFRIIANSEKMFQGSKLSTYSNKHSAQTNRQRLIHKAKMKSLRISVVIIFAFLICWTPYYVMMIIFMFWNPDKRFAEDLQSAIFFFGMSNSLVNPLIYGVFHLCPMHRKASRHGRKNYPRSLNRADSQRTHSILTAVTQVDNPERPGRTTRPHYFRTPSNGSNSINFDHHIDLVEVVPHPIIISKSIETQNHSHNRTTKDMVSHLDQVTRKNTTTGLENSSLLRMQQTMLKKHNSSESSDPDRETLLNPFENISSV